MDIEQPKTVPHRRVVCGSVPYVEEGDDTFGDVVGMCSEIMLVHLCMCKRRLWHDGPAHAAQNKSVVVYNDVVCLYHVIVNDQRACKEPMPGEVQSGRTTC